MHINYEKYVPQYQKKNQKTKNPDTKTARILVSRDVEIIQFIWVKCFYRINCDCRH